MTTVTIHEAEANLRDFVERAAQGEPFLISREGQPSLRVTVTETALLAPDGRRRLGFLEGQGTVPHDFKEMFRKDIEEMFGLED